ncbi:MAG TPA: DUF268 domain-containing protein [Thermoanaerobaculia bacterium]
MHPVNRFLSAFGVRLSRLNPPPPPPVTPPGFEYLDEQFEQCRKNNRGFAVEKRLYFQSGEHPRNYVDFECAFAAKQLLRERPAKVMDIGSYRQFIIGLLARGEVITLDVRKRTPDCPTETVLTGDAKTIPLPDDSLDAIVSLCAIEHFGLGRYGDEFDPEGDLKAFREMRRVIKPGGTLIFTTTMTGGRPTIWFNAHRVYDRAMLDQFVAGMTRVDEEFFSQQTLTPCTEEQLTKGPEWDVYAGCWRKNAPA